MARRYKIRSSDIDFFLTDPNDKLWKGIYNCTECELLMTFSRVGF